MSGQAQAILSFMFGDLPERVSGAQPAKVQIPNEAGEVARACSFLRGPDDRP